MDRGIVSLGIKFCILFLGCFSHINLLLLIIFSRGAGRQGSGSSSNNNRRSRDSASSGASSGNARRRNRSNNSDSDDDEVQVVDADGNAMDEDDEYAYEDSDDDSHDLGGTAAASSGRSTQTMDLSQMFAQPTHLMHRAGGFMGAKNFAKDARRWLLVNIQSEDDFACHALNRDVWRNDMVESIVREGFILFQAVSCILCLI